MGGAVAGMGRLGGLRRSLLTIGGVAAGLAGFALLLYFALPDVGAAGQVAGMVQAAVAALTIAAAGLFAGFKLQLFRDFEPHLTIAHEVSHRPVGAGYTHIAVTATLRNTSRVNVELRQGFYSIQQIAPITDEAVARIYSEFIADDEIQQIQWPTLEEFEFNWEKGEFAVEPGETHNELIEFVIPANTRAVVIYTYFHNREPGTAEDNLLVWEMRSVYDMIDRRPEIDQLEGVQ